MPSLSELIPAHRALLILAPMQNVTDVRFWRVLERYGGPDLYYTVFFRVHRDSTLERRILRDIEQNPTGRPVIAQMIGEDIPSLIRTATALQRYPIAGIDLNLGCPAPLVCRKNVGGGLLKNPQHIDAILRALRPVVGIPLTVKTRIGWADPSEFDRLLEVFAAHPVDAFTVHGRTVRQAYRGEVHCERIRQAVERLKVPVFANGNVLSVAQARQTLAATGAAGLMIGRGAVRNPWIFQQIRDEAEGRPPFVPTLRDLRAYIDLLAAETHHAHLSEAVNIDALKKCLNFIAPGIGPENAFLSGVRRAATERELQVLCDQFLESDAPFNPEPPGSRL